MLAFCDLGLAQCIGLVTQRSLFQYKLPEGHHVVFFLLCNAYFKSVNAQTTQQGPPGFPSLQIEEAPLLSLTLAASGLLAGTSCHPCCLSQQLLSVEGLQGSLGPEDWETGVHTSICITGRKLPTKPLDPILCMTSLPGLTVAATGVPGVHSMATPWNCARHTMYNALTVTRPANVREPPA